MKKFFASIVLFIFSFINIHHSMGAFMMMQKTNKKQTIISEKQVSQNNNGCCSHKKCDCCKIHKQIDKSLSSKISTKVIKKVYAINSFEVKISIKDIINKNLIKLNPPPWFYYKQFSTKNIIWIIKKQE